MDTRTVFSGSTRRTPLLGSPEITRIFTELKRPRLSDETVCLRNAAVNLIDGMINMSFCCDGLHYIDHENFLEKLDTRELGETHPTPRKNRTATVSPAA